MGYYTSWTGGTELTYGVLNHTSSIYLYVTNLTLSLSNRSIQCRASSLDKNQSNLS